MPTCIICHENIEIEESSSIKSYTCPNGHQVHRKCLEDWLVHSQVCPLCAEKYDSNTISEFTEYFDKIKEQKEQEKQIKADIELENVISNIADDIILLEKLELPRKLIKQKEFKKALEKLFALIDDNSQNMDVLFLIGKTFYLDKQYALAVNHLMKLIKKDFKYPQGFYYLGKTYQALGLNDKAKWAFDRVPSEDSKS